mmetsp:Transcript_52841/g.128131  ORF Transcript_52841/g.128131 Transcript_52841/m.128131 type:complete len:542 (+) Transcript_52841:160-1785(+)
MNRGDDEYFNDDDDEEDVAASEQQKQQQNDQGPNDVITDTTNAIKRRILAIKSSFEPPPAVYLLGRTLTSVDYDDTCIEEASSLFWFTYRDNFPVIQPYGITTDAGWGCMLRSAQMLLAHTLRIHFQSKHWKPRRGDAFLQTLLTWFADYPSKTSSVYSLHNLCAAGLQYQVLPGEWVGPNTVSYVLRDLVELHQKTQPSLFRVHVSSEGTVYEQAVHDVMTRDGRSRKKRQQQKQQQKQKQQQQNLNGSSTHQHQSQQQHQVDSPLHPLDPVVSQPSSDSTTNSKSEWVEEWDTSLLLLIPLRLGLDRFNEDYVQSLAKTFSLPQSVGVLGGRPRGARWFYGAYSNGSKVIGLDPHTIQSTLPKVGGSRDNLIIDLSEEYRSTYFTRYPEVFDLKRMDPSVALGFYCENRKDFEQVKESLSRIHLLTTTTTISSSNGTKIDTTNGQSSNSSSGGMFQRITGGPTFSKSTPPVLVTFLDKEPDYDGMMNDLAAGGGDGGEDRDNDGDDIFFDDDGDTNNGGGGSVPHALDDNDDDDDFVML